MFSIHTEELVIVGLILSDSAMCQQIEKNPSFFCALLPKIAFVDPEISPLYLWGGQPLLSILKHAR